MKIEKFGLEIPEHSKTKKIKTDFSFSFYYLCELDRAELIKTNSEALLRGVKIYLKSCYKCVIVAN